MKKVLREMQTL